MTVLMPSLPPSSWIDDEHAAHRAAASAASAVRAKNAGHQRRQGDSESGLLRNWRRDDIVKLAVGHGQCSTSGVSIGGHSSDLRYDLGIRPRYATWACGPVSK